jgi:multidrug efflux pump subunit AcrA (membrane-fusion protein)
MKRRVIAIVVLALLIGAGWAAYFFEFETPRSTNSLLVSGNIEAHESLVSFKTVQSRIVALPFDEGQWVAAGTELARLDDSDYQKQAEVDQPALMVQEKQLSSSLEKLAAAKATVANDDADLEQKTLDNNRARRWSGTRPTWARRRETWKSRRRISNRRGRRFNEQISCSAIRCCAHPLQGWCWCDRPN